MREFNADPIRKAVLDSDNPLLSAATIIGAMVDVLAGKYGLQVASGVMHSLTSAIDDDLKPADVPQDPDYSVTDL